MAWQHCCWATCQNFQSIVEFEISISRFFFCWLKINDTSRYCCSIVISDHIIYGPPKCYTDDPAISRGWSVGDPWFSILDSTDVWQKILNLIYPNSSRRCRGYCSRDCMQMVVMLLQAAHRRSLASSFVLRNLLDSRSSLIYFKPLNK